MQAGGMGCRLGTLGCRLRAWGCRLLGGMGLQAGCEAKGEGHRVLCARVEESVEGLERAAQVAHLVRVRSGVRG